ncbi:unnamed protein product, partial [Gongylonema pulchrum]|uniref:MFS domain-containing protein n=1 Tax=Gongylonema pulchrum TaxID=637853 RepID=A0A183E7F6_9BILA
MAADSQATALLGSTRFNLALIGFLGCVVIYALRSDVSFAIVCMVNSTAVDLLAGNTKSNVSKHTTCQIRDDPADTLNSKKDVIMGELIWPKYVQGSVLSAFFWGYFCSQILGGYLAGRYGGRLVIVLGSSILTMFSPLAATTSVYAFIAARALLGFMQGAIFPAFHTMWSMWAPPLERSLLTGVTYAGAQIGNTVVMPLSGLLCKYGFAGGWPSIFYVLGIAGVAWCALWFFYVSDRPSRSKRISKNELNYIEDSLSDVLSSDAKKALGFLTAIPYIAYFVFIN